MLIILLVCTATHCRALLRTAAHCRSATPSPGCRARLCSGGEAALSHHVLGWAKARAGLARPPGHAGVEDLTGAFADGSALLAILASVDGRRFPYRPSASTATNFRAAVHDAYQVPSRPCQRALASVSPSLAP